MNRWGYRKLSAVFLSTLFWGAPAGFAADAPTGGTSKNPQVDFKEIKDERKDPKSTRKDRQAERKERRRERREGKDSRE